MLQVSLKVFFLFIFLRLCKRLFRNHVQVRFYGEVDYLYVKHCVGPPIPEAKGTYASPRLCRYRYPYWNPPCISRPLAGLSISTDPLVVLSVNVYPTYGYLYQPLQYSLVINPCTA